MMAVITLNGYAEALLQAFDESNMKTDAGVQAVLTYLLAYPGQTSGDLASATGFDDAAVRGYLSALGDLVESDGAIWRASARGCAEIEHALAAAVGSVKGSGAAGAAALTAAEAKRWDDIKRIVMDSSSAVDESLRTQFEHWFRVTDSIPKTSHTDRTEAEASCTFHNQGNMGITIHRPGTQPVIDFENLTDTFGLDASDRAVILKALGLGLTFW
jgi:hypothetical protein